MGGTRNAPVGEMESHSAVWFDMAIVMEVLCTACWELKSFLSALTWDV